MAKLYEAQNKQFLFHTATADEVLFGGAAGGGKSYAIIWDAMAFGLQHTGVRISIFRRTFPELEKSIIEDWLKYIPSRFYEYNKKEHKATLKNGSFIEFNHCELEEDMYKYQSAQYDRLYFDELTTFPESIYIYLHSRCRTVNPNIKPQIKSATNPTGIGHLWVKSRFVDNAEPNKVIQRIDEETKNRYTTTFVPSRVYDNKYIMEADPAYIERLMKLPEEQRKALLDGSWDIAEGQFFKEWNRHIHVIEPFKIPSFWTRACGMDWGYSQPTVILWIAFSPKNDPVHKGRAYVYKELVITRATDTEIKREFDETNNKEKIDYIACDPKLWSVTQLERGESIASRLIEMGMPLIKADNARVSGWNVVRSYLAHDDKNPPSLYFFNNCYYTIRTIPSLIYSRNNPEDLESKGTEDHGADSLRYILMSKPLAGRIPGKIRPYNSFQYWFEKIRSSKQKIPYVGSF